MLLDGAGNPAQAKAEARLPGTPQHSSAWNIPRVLPHNGAALFPGFPRFYLCMTNSLGVRVCCHKVKDCFLSPLYHSPRCWAKRLHPLAPGERKAPCSSVQEESKPVKERERSEWTRAVSMGKRGAASKNMETSFGRFSSRSTWESKWK